jgi:hypothetical protein
VKVFVSYSSRDRRAALQVKEAIDRLGHDAWMDVFDIRAGAALDAELEERVRGSDALCLLLSPSAVESRYVQDETRHARAARAKGLRLIPLLLRPARIPDSLADLLYLDATRGIEAPGFVLALSRALDGVVDETQVLDASTRETLADRALVDEAEAAFPGLREDLAPFLERPIHRLALELDHETWPDHDGSILEVVLKVDGFRGAATFKLAPYVEGHTWPDGALEERAPDDFFGSTRPRVDVRFDFLGHDVPITKTIADPESPLDLSVTLDGEPYKPAPKGGPTYVAERFEIPPLSVLIDKGSSVTLWRTRPGSKPERVDPRTTDIDMRLAAHFVENSVDHELRIWSSRRTRHEAVLERSPTLVACESEIERELLLAAHYPRPLYTNDRERKQRIGAALDAGTKVSPEDGWIAFRMMKSASDTLAFRRQFDRAALELHKAMEHVPEISLDDYGRVFEIWHAQLRLASLFAEGSGSNEVVRHYLDQAVATAERAAAHRPGEPDYRRAIGRARLHRARLFAKRTLPVEPSDLTRPLAIVEELIAEDPLPWRTHELEEVHAKASEIARSADLAVPPAPLASVPVSAAWLDPKRRSNEEKQLVGSPLLRCSTFLSFHVPQGPRGIHLVDDEVIELYADKEARGWLSLGLQYTRDLVPSGLLALAPFGLVPGEWTVLDEESVIDVGDTVKRLEVDEVTAVRARVRRGNDAVLRLYMLRASNGVLRWTVTLAFPERGPKWEDAAADDATAAHTFSRFEIA